ncbi:MAG TPA: M4 family metallopeptidase [Vicinamibacterales bacterium]|nr:M4 family metallopeptidase [Vicinamibacterales bacterium]
MRRLCSGVALVLSVVVFQLFWRQPTIHGEIQAQRIVPTSADEVRAWDQKINAMVRSNELNIRVRSDDTLIPGRTIERLDQYYRGVRVLGGDVNRQLGGGSTISVFGLVYSDISLDPSPLITEDEAKVVISRAANAEFAPDRSLDLVILPRDTGYVLVWVGEILAADDSLRIFVDAKSGSIVATESTIERQIPNAYIGQGFGVLGDTKKIGIEAVSGGFVLFDTVRPPDISTFDLHANLTRVQQFQAGFINLGSNDYGFSSGTTWGDPVLVDAQSNASLTYDYYYKRFGRRGLDNANRRMWNLVHLVNRSGAASSSASVLGLYYINAFYDRGITGAMYYGEGIPPNLFLSSNGHTYNYFAAAIDIVAHELTHGVTQYTSNLQYLNESGALNEAFSDIMGASVKFYFHPPGNGLLQANYSMGADISIPVVPGALPAGERSLSNPSIYGDPDHYSKRYLGSADNGGVHTNSLIASHAFFLAIEGGTNRTSGISVVGVGSSNREQIEKIFYRAFAQLMPSNATFSSARAITLQAAQDLYGLNSTPYNAVRNAWTAVGVN